MTYAYPRTAKTTSKDGMSGEAGLAVKPTFETMPERTGALAGQWLAFLGGHGIHPKLEISSPGDAAEMEADRAAVAVMEMESGILGRRPPLQQLTASPPLQRMCKECGEEEKPKDGKGASEEQQEIDGHVSSEIRALSGRGSPLHRAERSFFEPRFGRDFASVRVHTDTHAASLARSVNARAFTTGRDIVFGAGEYTPGTNEGRHLLAHELAHVAQQEGAEPQVQRLTVTQHKLTKGTCRGRNVQWVFSLDAAAPADGYIVQQVDQHELISSCPTVLEGPPSPVRRFWEAWFVKKGDKVDWTTTRDSWTDGNQRSSQPNTNGSDIATGEIKFFLKSVTGDLGDFGTAPADPTSAWGPGKVASSGALPSTASEPSWWANKPTEGPVERGVWASWNCCGADAAQHSFDLTAKP